jgi:hypothetical protein
MNSVDKTAAGDYLVSARHTCAIYKVSGVDGSIIWTLGGKNSSFELTNFNFAYQHHIRLRDENSTHTTISFLNNAADSRTSTADLSTALVVSLDTTTMKAEAIRKYNRPDGQLSKLRGDVQFLPNKNVLVGWSAQGYTSEFTDDGKLVQEVIYPSDRYNDYRTHKYEFKGYPKEPPALKAFVYGTSPDATTTVHYVSWNGATEVAKWNFYASTPSNGTLNSVSLLGSSPRTGFETMFMSSGYHGHVFAEAIAADGKSLGNSSIEAVVVPPGKTYAEADMESEWNILWDEFSNKGAIFIGVILTPVLLSMLWALFIFYRRRNAGSGTAYDPLLAAHGSESELDNDGDIEAMISLEKRNHSLVERLEQMMKRIFRTESRW